MPNDSTIAIPVDSTDTPTAATLRYRISSTRMIAGNTINSALASPERESELICPQTASELTKRASSPLPARSASSSSCKSPRTVVASVSGRSLPMLVSTVRRSSPT